jgi:multicomponent Na+:H+ antiporter subunit D
MEVYASLKPLYALLVSLSAVILIGVSRKRPNLRETWTLLAALLKLAIVASMLPLILEGKVVECLLATVAPGLELRLKVDSLGLLFATTASFLWLITSVYSIGYMRALEEHAQTRYYMCFAVALFSATGLAFAANLFTLFVFYEVLTLSTYPLVAHKQTPDALKGARRYLTFLLGTSILFQLPAIIMTYFYAGTLDFSSGGILAGKAPDAIITVMFILFIAGTAKAAIMPLHSWLPAAMVAPTPVSALLHAVAVVKAGVFTVTRVVLYVFGIDLLAGLGLGVVLACLASFTIITASIIALRQDNLKARLAYSTISQLSYIILAVALLTPSGITSGIMHITIHAFGKITLFFAAGAIYVAAHKTQVSELDGIGRRMPFTMGAFTVGALSMIAVPPAAGFVSKWYLLLGAVEAHQILVIIVIITSTLLNAGYYLPIVCAAFFKEGREVPCRGDRLREAPATMVAPLVITASGVLLLFFTSNYLFNMASIVTASVTGGN